MNYIKDSQAPKSESGIFSKLNVTQLQNLYIRMFFSIYFFPNIEKNPFASF